MDINNSKILLSYEIEAGESLVKAGVHQEAKVSIIRDVKSGNKLLNIIKPMKTIEEPVYEKARISTSLGKQFIEGALERPVKSNNMTNADYDHFRKWNQMSFQNKLNHAINVYVSDMGGKNHEWELI